MAFGGRWEAVSRAAKPDWVTLGLGELVIISVYKTRCRIDAEFVKPENNLSVKISKRVTLSMHIKYDRTCQRAIKIISIEKTFALHKSAQKKHVFLEFFLKGSSWWALLNHLKIENFENWWLFYPGWYLKIFKLSSCLFRLGIVNRVEWLWNPSDSLVICFCGLDGEQDSIAFLTFWSYWPTKASHYYIPLQFVSNNNNNKKVCVTAALLCLSLMFSAFHNQSPLLTMVWVDNWFELQYQTNKQTNQQNQDCL